MKPFTYERANSPAEAATAVARHPGAKFLAGGTNLLDLMKLEIETPAHLVDVQDIKLDRIEKTPDGGLRVGALVTNTQLAADERVSCPLLSGPSTMRVWIKEGTTNACEKAQARRDHREAA